MSIQKNIFALVLAERAAQDERWGVQNHPDGTSAKTYGQWSYLAKQNTEAAVETHGEASWLHILGEEVLEAAAEEDPVKLKAELVQVAAVAVAWLEDLERRGV